MSKNLVINGITYNGVDSFEIPDTTGKDVVFVPADEAGEGGVRIPDLENPASASDIVQGKQAIDADGNVVEGTVTEETGTIKKTDDTPVLTAGKTMMPIGKWINPRIELSAPVEEDILLRAGSEVKVDTEVTTELFGDAYPSDVRKGCFFTSDRGFRMEGTYDVEEQIVDILNNNTPNPDEVIDGKNFFGSNGELQEGTMPNQNAVYRKLYAGEEYPIVKGYHNGEGYVEAAPLSEQTEGTADAGDIAKGKTAWVNGEKVTGTYSNPLASQVPANAQAEDILSGKTAFTGSGTFVYGSMPNNGAVDVDLDFGGSYTVPKGYHDGTGVVQGAVLPELTNPAGENDVFEGKEYIDQTGAKRYGMLKDAGVWTPDWAVLVPVEVQYDSDDRWLVMQNLNGFGDATEADVVAGKTFTNAQGVARVGTAQGGGSAVAKATVVVESWGTTTTFYTPDGVYDVYAGEPREFEVPVGSICVLCNDSSSWEGGPSGGNFEIISGKLSGYNEMMGWEAYHVIFRVGEGGCSCYCGV